jgi:hypothetical protein
MQCTGKAQRGRKHPRCSCCGMYGGMPGPPQLGEQKDHEPRPLVVEKRDRSCRASTLFRVAPALALRHPQIELKLQQGNHD